ncbi:nicotinamide-nucleotide amidohydrolase family protein [Bordetella petrii]|nr:nicotinamide-nucleotide amidohydrolase family protein [Bordetella petrii]
MNEIERVARFMSEHSLVLVTAESCTAGLIAATLADVPGAGSLLDCAFVTYAPDAKMRCLGLDAGLLRRYNLTSEPVARAMALGASRHSPASVAIANTGVSDDTDDDIAPGTQCYAWLFRAGAADAKPVVYTETRVFSGGRNAIRLASARYALARLPHYHQAWQAGEPPAPVLSTQEPTMKSTPRPTPTADDTPREAQKSHGDAQNRSKKDGHATQVGSGQDQQSQRNRGAGARRS